MISSSMDLFKPLIALPASVNPIGAVPFFLAFTQGLSRSEGQRKAYIGLSGAVVPLTIPLLIGPATISTVVSFAEKTQTFVQHAVLVGYGVVIALATYPAFAASGRIARVPGRTGIYVMTRLMGLILAAMAVELLADRLVKLFPILASPTLR